MEFKNDLGLVGKIAAHSVMSGKYKDKDGNIKEILPVGPGNSLDFDQFREDIGAFGGGSGGTDIDKEHPAAGVDIYPGSLANGEITERYCLWQGNSDPTQITNVSFGQDVGSKMDKVGEGLTFLLHVQRTAINKGIKGEVTKIPFNYDPSNAVKDGYYTTTAPVPSYIKAKSFEVDKEQVITYNGIGENLTTIKNHESPGIGFTFKADKTMDIRPIQGFDNDGAADGITGYTYDVIVEVIATYSTQIAVQQLPDTTNLFTGLASGDVVLSGSSNFFENVMDGIEITFDDNLYQADRVRRVEGSKFLKSKVIRIPKAQLINNLSFVDIPYNSNATNVQKLAPSHGRWSSMGNPESFEVADKPVITIESSSIKISGSFKNSSTGYFVFYLNISKITPYKD